MASVFDLFKQAPAAPANAGITTPPAAATGTASSNPTVPNANNTPVPSDVSATVAGNDVNTNQNASPLDNYKDLWKTDPNAKPDAPFTFNSDPSKLMDTAKGVDFRKIVTPETMAMISKGGAEAQTAMLEAMNNMTQMAFAQSAHASAKITESALQAQEQRFKEMLPTLIKQHSVNDSFRAENPLMNDPALAPMIGALQSQFTKQYPQATAMEIKNHVNDYLNGAADKIASLRPKPIVNTGRPQEDWGNFFNMN